MDMNRSEELSYRFDGYHLLPKRRLLLHAGEPVSLTRRTLNVLIVLVSRHERVVSKDEILDEAFPGVLVAEQNIAVHVSILRRRLGPDLIATIPGLGYRFAGKLEQGETPIAPAPIADPPHPAATNLPNRPKLIGREVEIDEVQALIDKARLVTLSGPGGVGKTKLAIELGWQALDRFPGGVWLVDLAPLQDPDLFASATATALGIGLADNRSARETIARAIADRRLLLIFDNSEHLLAEVAAMVGFLLGHAPGLSVLLTSQEVINMPAEVVYRLEPLSLPPPGTPIGDLLRFGAVALFVARARAADRRFQLETGNAESVAALCRGLDGLPLTLEMAASRLPMLGIERLKAGIATNLQVLGSAPRVADARHRSVLAMLDWSLGLLGTADRRIIRRLGVFRGSFSLEAAVAVGGEAGAESWQTIDALGRLADRSLLTVEMIEPPRYRLLETLRLYVAVELASSGEGDLVALSHARYFRDLFERADAAKRTASDSAWLETYRLELDNVRSALDWALADERGRDIAIELAGTAGVLWYLLGLLAEGRRYLDRAVLLIEDATPALVKARLLRQVANHWGSSDRRRSVALLERSADAYRLTSERAMLADVLVILGSHNTILGEYARARPDLEEADRLLVGDGRLKALYNLLTSLGILGTREGDGERARAAYARALDCAQQMQDGVRSALVWLNLAELEFGLGRLDQAMTYGRRAVDGLRGPVRRNLLTLALHNLAAYLTESGALDDAAGAAAEAFTIAGAEGGSILRSCLQQWALIGALRGQTEAAARLIGFVDAGYQAADETRQPTEQRIYDQLRGLLARTFPDGAIDAYGRDGAAWSESEAAGFAAAHLIRIAADRSDEPGE
jgi:predicted ATPase/DNA-binding winged helix-turn-helix (wHTH) protein